METEDPMSDYVTELGSIKTEPLDHKLCHGLQRALLDDASHGRRP